MDIFGCQLDDIWNSLKPKGLDISVMEFFLIKSFGVEKTLLI